MTTEPDPRTIIERSLKGWLVPGAAYHRPLPPELERWYCYTTDGGHSILVTLAADGPPREEGLVPAPVKAVLRAGWEIVDGFVVADLPYNRSIGLVLEPGDDEFGEEPGAGHDPGGQQPGSTIEVGRPYNPRITSWPDGHAELRLTPGGAEFLLVLGNPARHELRAFAGNAEFAIVPSDRWLLWLYRFDDPNDSNPRHGLPWSDAPWQYHRQAVAGPVGVPGAPGGSFLLQLILINAGNGIVEHIRVVSPPVEFADAVREAVARQAATAENEALAAREIQTVYAQYGSADLLLRASARMEALRDGTR